MDEIIGIDHSYIAPMAFGSSSGRPLGLGGPTARRNEDKSRFGRFEPKWIIDSLLVVVVGLASWVVALTADFPAGDAARHRSGPLNHKALAVPAGRLDAISGAKVDFRLGAARCKD